MAPRRSNAKKPADPAVHEVEESDGALDSVDGVLPPTTPPSADQKGGSPTPPASAISTGGGSVTTSAPAVTTNPEDVLPERIQAAYTANNQVDTGVTYASHARKFLAWMRQQSLTFANMPPGCAKRFLDETIPNPITRNVAVYALRKMFELAQEIGVRMTHNQLPLARYPTQRKRKETPAAPAAPGASQMTTPSATVSVFPPPQPAPVATAPVAEPQPQVAPAVAAASPAKPQPQPKAPSVFGSLGTRVQVYKVADYRETPMIALGHEIPIGNPYQKEQLEADGSLENFIMRWIRPVHGPFAGEQVRLYKIRQLDTSGRPMPGAEWTVPVGPSDTAGPTHHQPAAPTMQPGYPQPWPMPSSFHVPAGAQPPPTFGGAPMSIIDRMLDSAQKAQEKAEKQYEELVRSITAKNNGAPLDAMTLMFLQQQRPEPLDFEKMRRQLREELAATQPAVPVAPAPQQPLGDLFGPSTPKPDPAFEFLTKMVTDLSTQVKELTIKAATPPPAPAQKDPLETFAQMMGLMRGAEAKPDPMREKLLDLAIAKLTQPEKSKTLQEALAEYEAIKRLTEGAPPGPLDGLFDTINNLIENAPQVGEAIGRMKAAGVSAMIKPNRPAAQRPGHNGLGNAQAAAKPQQAPPKPASAQPQVAPAELQAAFLKMIKTPEGQENSDALLVQELWAVLELMGKLGGTWAGAAEKVLELYKSANGKPEVQTAVTNLFRWVGARALLKNPVHVDRLTRVLFDNYSTIYGVMTGGGQKALEVLPEQAPQAVTPPAPATTSPAPEPADGDDDDEDDAEPEADETGDAAAVSVAI